MRFLVDAQLPPALARWLVSEGYDARHVEDLGLRHADDTPIWERAKTDGCALMSKDDDFHRRWLAGRRDVPVVWLRCGNIRNRLLFQKLKPILPDIVARLRQNETLIEIL